MLLKSQVKYIQSLGDKKFRETEGIFVAEGSKLVSELALSPQTPLQELYATREWLDGHDQFTKLLSPEKIVRLRETELERISFLSTPQQVLGLFRKPKPSSISAAGQCTLALDGIRDPGNLGTIIRIADWFGVKDLVCSETTADAFSPKVVQSTMGSIARVNIGYTGLADWLQRNHNVEAYATVLNGQPLSAIGHLKEGIIVIGNESRGISEEVLALCKTRISIPGKGSAESLNAAVATGIVLSHLVA